jgi:hypothetical protein
MKNVLLGCVVVAMVGCASVDEGAETRPEGESVLSPEALRAAKGTVDFEQHVKPILEARCLYCHDGNQLPGKYNLTSGATGLATGPSGPRIVPGNADASLMISFISSGNHAMSMPAVGTRVSKEEVEILRRWINQGAEWPEGAAGKLEAVD